MLASQIPAKVPLPFASSGTKNAIPTASQIGVTAGAASLTDGFPPLTFTPLASGGVPPAGADFNGILNLITAVQQWQSAGGIFKYDSTFSTSIGGYPKGSIIMSASNDTAWLNLVDNNTTNPDATDGSAANWAPLEAYGIAAIAGLTNANVTLTPAQFGKPIITLSGTLTGNVQIVFPLTLQQWSVVNNTTGAFAVTCKTAAGTGGAVTQGASQLFYGDGTNLVPMPADARYAKLAGLATQIFSAANAVGTNDVVPLGQGDGRYAKLAGLLSQVFRVANGVAANDAVALGQFAFTNGANGVFKIPMVGGNLIVQWGQTGSIAVAAAISVTFPIAFPNFCFFVNYIGDANNAAGNANETVVGKNTIGFSSTNYNAVAANFNWVAIGW